MNNLKIVFSDFDGTLTFKESLLPIFFEILNFLKYKKIPLVIVTGRSLSWGHFLLTHFPDLETVIAEGGGVIIKKTSHNFLEDCLVSEKNLLKLNLATQKLLNQFKGIELSKDSFGRKTDRAIELFDLKDLNLLNANFKYRNSSMAMG